MATVDEFVCRVISQVGRLRSSTRNDLERELRAHLEDAMEQARAEDKNDLPRVACRRFGDPEEIGRELEHVHRFERRAVLAADASLLLGVSVVAVAAVVCAFQLSIATWIGISPSHAFPRLRGQLVGFVSLALGYMSLYWEERILKRFRPAPAVLLNLIAFASLFTLASPLLHLRSVAAATPFIAGALVRLLQRTSVRGIWCLGTLLPTIAAALIGGRLLSTGGETPLWIAVLIRWIGQTGACYLLTLLARSHERRFNSAL
jgi:hypothetical protein